MPQDSPSHSLPIWQITGQSLLAPFRLNSKAWLILARPILVMLFISLLAALWYWLSNSISPVMGSISWLLMLFAIAWFAVDYLRLQLIGSEAYQPAHQLLRHYGVASLVLFALALLLSLLLGMLLYTALPAMIFFAFALISPDPWLAAGFVIVVLLVIFLAALPVVRLLLIIPALAVSHPAMPSRIWSLGRGQSFRLLLLLVIVPGLLNAILLPFAEWPATHWSLQLLLSLLNIYLLLFVLSLLANSYRQLSDIDLPDYDADAASDAAGRSSAWLRPMLGILLLGGCLLLLSETIYVTDPGQESMITRLGKADRVDKTPGFGLKLPFVEQAKPVQPEDGYNASGEDRFFTRDKSVIALSYSADWEVIDAERFRVAMAGKHQIASIRISQLLQDQLRNSLIRLDRQQLAELKLADSVEFSSAHPINPRLDEIQPAINDKLSELGVEMTRWQLQQPPTTTP